MVSSESDISLATNAAIRDRRKRPETRVRTSYQKESLPNLKVLLTNMVTPTSSAWRGLSTYNMKRSLAPFGRWTLHDNAAQRRYATL